MTQTRRWSWGDPMRRRARILERDEPEELNAATAASEGCDTLTLLREVLRGAM